MHLDGSVPVIRVIAPARKEGLRLVLDPSGELLGR